MASAQSMEECLEFAEYGGGIILPEQIPTREYNITVIDARDAGQCKFADLVASRGMRLLRKLRRVAVPHKQFATRKPRPRDDG